MVFQFPSHTAGPINRLCVIVLCPPVCLWELIYPFMCQLPLYITLQMTHCSWAQGLSAQNAYLYLITRFFFLNFFMWCGAKSNFIRSPFCLMKMYRKELIMEEHSFTRKNWFWPPTVWTSHFFTCKLRGLYNNFRVFFQSMIVTCIW